MTVEVVVFGVKNSGQTTLCQLLTGKAVDVSSKSTSNYDVFRSQKWDIWNTKNLSQRGRINSQLISNAQIALFCVDVSENYVVQEIKEKIVQFRAHNPNAPLILVGTKQDKCVNDQRLNAIFQQINSELPENTKGFAESIFFSAQDNGESLVNLSQRMKALGPGASYPLQRARNKLDPSSLLYQAIDNFITAAEKFNLSDEQFMQLGVQIDLLLIYLRTNRTDKEELITMSIEECKRILNDQPVTLKDAFAGIVTAVITSLLVFTIGFAIGCASSAWTGPFALLAGIATGSTAELLFISGGCGVTVGALTCFGFFKTSSIGSAEIERIESAARAEQNLLAV
ncbi:GTPase domain-containing protein [Legionella sp. PATHC035]|uniref:GTPase domain-containing protein n=1 Tax=Legionella sp. PATHC035 TaxID=2992040 RepID=UPI0022436EC2|nr:GTPase domain-containing protein [Legionella sp. PATHC035]MCW8408864.1 GTPase domain-containing protein [Legionella sp. PATHC035]